MEKSEFIEGFNKAISEVAKPGDFPTNKSVAGCRYLKNIGLQYLDMLTMIKKLMKPAFETDDAAEFIYEHLKEYIPQLDKGIEISIKKSHYWKCAKCYPYQYENDIRVLNDVCSKSRSCNDECTGKIVADVYRIEKVVNL